MEYAQIDLLRHGAVDSGACFRGDWDEALSPLGWQQLEAACEGQHWDFIFSSPRRRCADFAQQLATSLSVPYTIVDALREMNFGRWEGCKAADLLAEEQAQLSQFWRDPLSVVPPEGEAFADFRQRVVESWQTLGQTYQGQRILVITHSGVIKTLLAHCLAIPLSRLHCVHIDYAQLSRWHVFQDQIAVLMAHHISPACTPRLGIK